MNTIRELRMWHWAQRTLYRELAKAERAISQLSITSRVAIVHEDKAREYDAHADTHLNACQLLNGMPGCEGTTGEQDYLDRQERIAQLIAAQEQNRVPRP